MKLIDLNSHLYNINEDRFSIHFDKGYAIYEKNKPIKEWLDTADRNMYLEKQKRG